MHLTHFTTMRNKII